MMLLKFIKCILHLLLKFIAYNDYQQKMSHGSGVIIPGKDLIFTNFHIYEGFQKLINRKRQSFNSYR